MMSLGSDEEYLATCERKKTPKMKGNSRSPKFAETNQLNKLVTKHLLQLIGTIKWSNAIVIDHEMQVQKQQEKSSLKARYKMNVNNIGAYGLFIFQHHLYLTHLKVHMLPSGNHERFIYRTAIRDWGLKPIPDRTEEYVSPKFTIVEKYLDLFEPAHLKALLIYLRTIIWGPSPFAKDQPKPTIQHKD
jgi:hypothetical protein